MTKKRFSKINYFIIVLIAISFIIGFMSYGHLPEKVPSHWNIRGEVDGYSGKFFGAFGMPLTTLGIYLFMIFVPKIDPKKENYKKFAHVYDYFVFVIVLFLLFMYAITLLVAFNYSVDVGKFVSIGVGILFIVMGNYLTKVRHNYFLGIKTPWTLASENVWKKTHRLGGTLFVISGILILLSIFTSSEVGFIITIGSALGVTLISTIYSYLVFRRETVN